MSATSERQPNLSKLSDALLVLSEELPRLATMDSVALLTSLDTLMQELRSTIVTKDVLEQALESKLTGIEGRLDSIDLRLRQSFHDPQISESREGNVPTKMEQPTLISEDAKSKRTKDAVSTNSTQSGGNYDLAHGPLGAFVVILATLIPLFVILVW